MYLPTCTGCSAHATYIHTARMEARVRALFSRYVMFERFDGCRMSHLVGPRDSVVRLVRVAGCGNKQTNRAQIYLEIIQSKHMVR